MLCQQKQYGSKFLFKNYPKNRSKPFISISIKHAVLIQQKWAKTPLSAEATPALTSSQLLTQYLTAEMLLYFKKKCPQDSEALLLLKLSELLKFLSLAHHLSSDLPVSFDIDDLWHLWILQTRDYQALTKKLPSGAFIHHSSKDYPNHAILDQDVILEQQLSFLASYFKNFGPFAEPAIPYWPMAQQLSLSLGSTAKLNTFLQELQ